MTVKVKNKIDRRGDFINKIVFFPIIDTRSVWMWCVRYFGRSYYLWSSVRVLMYEAHRYIELTKMIFFTNIMLQNLIRKNVALLKFSIFFTA